MLSALTAGARRAGDAAARDAGLSAMSLPITVRNAGVSATLMLVVVELGELLDIGCAAF